MCGRCMKTCPWNLEGLFAEAPFRWAASNVPALARPLARLDDALGRGGLNPAKKWWWDIELSEDGAYRPARAPLNARDLQKDLVIRAEDQTLAVYPAPLAPPPWPYPAPMDREAGIKAYRAMLSAEEHRAKLARGERDHLHRYTVPGDAPVTRVAVTEAEALTPDITLYTLATLDGADLPAWRAGAHLDIVVAPEFVRAYSLCSDPADRQSYQIAVLREAHGRGGSALMHRIFTPGRKVFVSHPINHFELVEGAPHTLLMGGGIGVTPMIAFAHRLHALGHSFALHYSISTRSAGAFLARLAAQPWADRVHLHISDEGTRADLPALLTGCAQGTQVYACGPEGYMTHVTDAATAAGLPEEAQHVEYFAVPDGAARENHPFTLALGDGRTVPVRADQSASDALAEAGLPVDVKCADGLCGVCQARLIDGAVEHRDLILSAAQRRDTLLLCCSRAAEPGGTISIKLP